MIGPGILLVGEPAFTLVARQYHERVFEFDGGVFLRGNVVAPFIWSLLDRQRVRCRGGRDRRVDRPHSPRPVARSRSIPPGASRSRRDGVLRSRHHIADGAPGTHRQRRSALLPHDRERARPWSWLHRAAAMARLRDLSPQCVSRSAVSRRAVDQLAVRRHQLLRPQDDVDRDRHAGRAGSRRSSAGGSVARQWVWPRPASPPSIRTCGRSTACCIPRG